MAVSEVASDGPAVTTDGVASAPEPAMEAQLTAVPSARRSVAELQKMLLANPVAGPPLEEVARLLL